MEYPRVTEILRHFNDYERVPPQIMKRASARGSSVHSICAGIAEGAWIPDGMIDPELRGYVNSFKQWADNTVESFDIIEQRYCDTSLGFSGQIDMVINGKDGTTQLIDLKTSAKPQKTHPVQVAAYDYLLRTTANVTPASVSLVYLSRDGEYPTVHTMTDLQEELTIFLRALQCYTNFHKDRNDDRTAKAS